MEYLKEIGYAENLSGLAQDPFRVEALNVHGFVGKLCRRKSGEGRIQVNRNRESERSAPIHFPFYPNTSTVTFHYLLAKRQSKAGARSSVPVQAAEQVEYPRSVLLVDADAIVAHREHPPFARSHGGEVDLGRRLAPVLDRVAHQVLEHL